MYGFKGTNINLKCKNFQFKLNETFYHQDRVEICHSGFHFCEKLKKVKDHYSFNKNNRFFIIKSGNKYETLEAKSVAGEITFLEEIKVDNLISYIESSKYREFLKKNINGLFILAFDMKIIDLNLLKYLHTHGANITVENNYALIIASKNGNLNVVKYLYENGVNITIPNNEAIRYASKNGHLEVVKYLHVNGANIRTMNDYAIIHASEKGHLEVVKYLHENGADITAENNQCLDWANENGYLKIAEYLLENGAKPY